jgi:hypothetical protein
MLASNHWTSNFLNREDHRFSHSGIVSRVDPMSGEVHVLHAHADNPGRFAAEVSLGAFVKTRKWAVFRVRAGPEQRAEIERLLSEVPDRQIPFDHGFDLGDDSGWYCAELVWRLWQQVGIDLVPNPPYLFGRRYIPIDGLYHDNPQVAEVAGIGR